MKEQNPDPTGRQMTESAQCAECKKVPEDNRYMYNFVRDGDFGPLKEVITYCRDCYKKKYLDAKEWR